MAFVREVGPPAFFAQKNALRTKRRRRKAFARSHRSLDNLHARERLYALRRRYGDAVPESR